MRLVEVRDWLAGQAWFDLHQYRLDPPDGVQMHWTRVLDAAAGAADPAFLALSARRKRGAADAHRLSPGAAWRAFRRRRWPRAKAGGSRRDAARGHHRRPDRRRARAIPAGTHPSPFRADPARRPDPVGDASARSRRDRFWPAAFAAALAALSLSINIENLTYILVEIAAFAFVFIARGERFRSALLGFGLSLAASSLIVVCSPRSDRRAISSAPATRFRPRISMGFSSARRFSAALAAISQPPGRCAPSRGRLRCSAARWCWARMALAYPACLHDPQADVDPLLRRLWLEHVEEARPLLSIVAGHPGKFITLALAAALGLARRAPRRLARKRRGAPQLADRRRFCRHRPRHFDLAGARPVVGVGAGDIRRRLDRRALDRLGRKTRRACWRSSPRSRWACPSVRFSGRLSRRRKLNRTPLQAVRVCRDSSDDRRARGAADLRS